MNTNLIALGALAVFCGLSSGCTAAVYPGGTVMTSYAAPVVVEEPVVVVEPAPVMVVEQVRPAPLLPLLVSRHRPVAHPVRHHVTPAPIKPGHSVSPARPSQPSHPGIGKQHGGRPVSVGGGKTNHVGHSTNGNHSRAGGGSRGSRK